MNTARVKILIPAFLFFNIAFAQTPADNKISREEMSAVPSVYPNGAYMFDSENTSPWSWIYDAGIVLGLKNSQTNYRHSQLILGYNPSYFSIRSKNGTSDAWSSWRRVLVESSNGFYGIGTNSPQADLHIKSSHTDLNSTTNTDANVVIEATSTTRSLGEGASLGFVVPANTDGNNPWQQGRILVTPDNTNNSNASGRMYLQTRYYTSGAWHWRKNLVLHSSGRVGIGTDTPSEMLSVNGTIRSKEVKVEASPWPDYVFEEGYDLKSLKEIEKYILENNHLPNIPPAQEVEEAGIALGEMNAKLLEKIEEMTLYMIEQEKKVEEQGAVIESLETKVQLLEEMIQKLLTDKYSKIR